MSEVGACWVDENRFEVRLDGKASHVSVTSDAHLHHTGDALLAFCLPIAMATGSRLVIEDDVDERLMRSQLRVQEVMSFRMDYPDRVSVSAPTVNTRAAAEHRQFLLRRSRFHLYRPTAPHRA